MAQMQIQSMLPFSPHGDPTQVGQRWLKWKRGFGFYMRASGIQNDERKKGLLLHWMGMESQEVVETLNLPAATTYDGVIRELDEYFSVQKNVSYERTVFHNAKQKDNESLEQYVTRLRKLAQFCQYEESLDEQLRDQVVATCKSKRLRKKLLVERDLTLRRVRELGKLEENAECLSEKLEEVRIKTETVNRIERKGKNPQNYHKKYDKPRNETRNKNKPDYLNKNNKQENCTRCGGRGHSGKNCLRTKGKTCLKCGKTGHFGIVCKSSLESGHLKNTDRKEKKYNPRYTRNKVNHLAEEDKKFDKYEDIEMFYIEGEVESDPKEDKTGISTYSLKELYEREDTEIEIKTIGDTENKFEVEINETKIPVLIDSGSTLNLIDENVYKSLKYAEPYRKSKIKIFAYQSKKPLNVLGKFVAKIAVQENEINTEIYVTREKGQSILSKSASESLNILRVGLPKIVEAKVNSVKSKSIDEIVNPVKPEMEIKWKISENTQKIIEKHENLFKGVGCYKNFAVKLHIDKSVVPVQQPIRRIPFHTRKKVSDEIRRLEKLDIIEKVNGPTTWINPVVPVIKSSGEVRLCLDMRRANEAIIRERHVIPKLDELVTELHGAKYFSKIDLREAYHQILLDESSRDITTFACHEGLYRYKRLVYGCKTAFEIFQRIVEISITGCEGARNLSDDILVWGSTLSELEGRTEKVFDRLSKNGFKVNLKKCVFGANEISFSGHVLSQNGISIMKDKVAAINKIEEPKNVAELKSFLGMVSYCHKFIRNYSTLSEPLRKLTRKSQKFVWGEEQKITFITLKEALKNAETMAYYNPHAETKITVDASPVGLGAILTQRQEDGSFKPVYYGSRALTDVESRYSQTEREALAVVWSCEYFHFYIFDNFVTIETDHKPLLGMLTVKSKPPPRIERWLMRLQAYSYELVYISGSRNSADCLSRNPQKLNKIRDEAIENYIKMIVTDAIPKAHSIKEIVEATSKDKDLVEVMKAVSSGRWNVKEKNSPYYKVRLNLSVKEGILLKDNCIIIPKTLRQNILRVAHKCHQGETKTLSMMREKVWWPGMREDLTNMIKECHGCQVNTPVRNKCEPLNMTPLPPKPMHLIAVDIKGPLVSGEYLLVFLDYYSRFPFVYVIKTITSMKIIECCESLFCMFGYPVELVSDNGSQFVSDETEKYLKMNNILHRKVSPYWPSANGEVERFNMTLGKTISSLEAEGKNWRVWLNAFLLDYRTSIHRAIGKTPADVLMRYKVKNNIPDYNENDKIEEHEEIQKEIQNTKKKLKYIQMRNETRKSSI